MKWSHAPSRVLGAAAGLALLLHAPAVFAFAEDVCFPSGGGAPFNCAALPAVCQPVGTTSPACLAAAAALFIGDQTIAASKIGAKRSMIHADSVNLLAQAVGFPVDDANWISAYGEVPDYGQFEPTDMQGQPLDGGAYQTVDLEGFKRTNITLGGSLYHYISIYNGGSATGPTGIDGLHPNTQDATTEYFLTHVRNWAMAGGGTSPPICAAGLTVESANGDYATGSTCFALSGQPALVDWTWETAGPQTYTINSGLQVLDAPDGGAAVLSDQFDTVVGNGAVRVEDARLGIYAHVLADRISHHACTDTCAMAGPTSGGSSTWSESETSSMYCAQTYHALFHIWETGVDFTALPAADRTTEATLSALYDELVSFATARNTLRSGAGDAATKSALVTAMATALEIQAVDARISAMAKVACDNGYQPFPGAPACGSSGAGGGSSTSGGSTSSGSGGSTSSGSGGSASSGGGGHGCSLSTVGGPVPMASGAAWLAVLFALRRRARRR
jgi:uncharacterized membrane protein YgcG